MAHVYVIRHGETEHNRQGIIQGPRIDSELSENGRLQAAALADAFEATPLDAVFTSPLIRARDTADALVRGSGVPVRVVPELYEMDFGDLCGQRVDDVRPVLEGVLQAWNAGFTDQALPGGESPVLVQHRVKGFVERLRAMDGHLGVVAHGRLNRVVLTTLLGRPLVDMQAFPQDNANVTYVERGPEGLVLRRQNDTSHYA